MKKIIISFIMLCIGLSLHANYSPALDWGMPITSSKQLSVHHSFEMMKINSSLARAEINRQLAIVLNALLGWGIGSFIQGDEIGGRTQLFLTLSSYGLVGLSVVPFVLVASQAIEPALYLVLSSGLGLASFIFTIATFINGLTRPGRYVKFLSNNYTFKKNYKETDKVISYNLVLANF